MSELIANMRVTYNADGSAMYIYLTGVGPSGVKKTQYRERIDVDLDTAGQIVVLRLCESVNLQLRWRLRHALLHPEVTFGEASRCLRISFATYGYHGETGTPSALSSSNTSKEPGLR